MTATHRIEWAGGTVTEVTFRLLPIVQIELETEHSKPVGELMVGTGNTEIFLRALWRQMQLRENLQEGFVEWASRIDDVQVLPASDPSEPPPLPDQPSSSPSESAGQQPGSADPFSS